MSDRGADAPIAGRQNAPSAHQLHLFLTLAEELHFRRSAQRVFMSQGAFSQQISALERRLGVPLVERTTRRVSLTRAGAELVPYARAVLTAFDELRQAAERHRDAAAGRAVIGASEAVTAMPPVPAVLNGLRERLPGLDIRVLRTGFAESPQAVLKGEVDAALVFLPVPAGIRALPLATGPRCAAMPSDDPLAGKDAVSLADLADRPVVGLSPGVPRVCRDYWSADPRPEGGPVRRTSHRVTDLESLLSLVALGEGIGFVPSLAREMYPRPGVSYVDVTDLPPWTSALAWLPENGDRPAVAALRQAARAALRESGGAPLHV
ncbi:LysR family transcriptional regulator [Actinomadura miaoliensis]|uniref:LysR substrate-binding domain-containing protein n=1 Tax=Actinomadura miaoliensis TaxID=430685 RepID=A0ABP7WSW4_9ACTN